MVADRRAGTGRPLQTEPALEAVRADLLPRVTLVTPNIAELARLTGSPPPRTDPEVDRAARRLLDTGPQWVLVTGGHRPGRFCRDRLHGPRGSGDARWYRAPRVETPHGHGTGCTLSSAIAARLALGDGFRTRWRRPRVTSQARLPRRASFVWDTVRVP